MSLFLFQEDEIPGFTFLPYVFLDCRNFFLQSVYNFPIEKIVKIVLS